jgi:hypothetical protein
MYVQAKITSLFARIFAARPTDKKPRVFFNIFAAASKHSLEMKSYKFHESVCILGPPLSVAASSAPFLQFTWDFSQYLLHAYIYLAMSPLFPVHIRVSPLFVLRPLSSQHLGPYGT